MWPSPLKNVRCWGVLIAEDSGEVLSLRSDFVLMAEYGGHFKMKNGNGAQCHLINVRPRWGGGPAACWGTHSPHTRVPGVRGGKWAESHGVTHLRHCDGDAGSQEGVVVRRVSLLGRCPATPSISVTQYCRHCPSEEPSSPPSPRLPSFSGGRKSLRQNCGCAWSVTPSTGYDPEDHTTWEALLIWVISVFLLYHSLMVIITRRLRRSSNPPLCPEELPTLDGHDWAGLSVCFLPSAALVLLYLAAASGPMVHLSLTRTAAVPPPRSQPSSICLTCASLFVFSRLLDAPDDIELRWLRSSIHARRINHSRVLHGPV